MTLISMTPAEERLHKAKIAFAVIQLTFQLSNTAMAIRMNHQSKWKRVFVKGILLEQCIVLLFAACNFFRSVYMGSGWDKQLLAVLRDCGFHIGAMLHIVLVQNRFRTVNVNWYPQSRDAWMRRATILAFVVTFIPALTMELIRAVADLPITESHWSDIPKSLCFGVFVAYLLVSDTVLCTLMYKRLFLIKKNALKMTCGTSVTTDSTHKRTNMGMVTFVCLNWIMTIIYVGNALFVTDPYLNLFVLNISYCCCSLQMACGILYFVSIRRLLRGYGIKSASTMDLSESTSNQQSSMRLRQSNPQQSHKNVNQSRDTLPLKLSASALPSGSYLPRQSAQALPNIHSVAASNGSHSQSPLQSEGTDKFAPQNKSAKGGNE
ncbi:hypothetical protein DFS34DRAFT_310962 [Phlyctochytrium arcticum]|nr:hypothetical protein DFS34DRAFT_310962 [Phlyctochytrium arcticum]